MTKPQCISCNIEKCLVKNCSIEWIDLISESKQTCLYKKKNQIFKEGEEVLGLFFIKEGKAKVYTTGTSGKDQIVRLTKSGDIIGHRGYGGEQYPISSSALEDSIICFVDNHIIYEAFMNNPILTFELMMYYSKELRGLELKIKKMAQMNVMERVIEALNYAKKIYPTNEFGSTIIHLERQDLADIAGVNTEQLSRILSELKKNSIISLNNKSIILKKGLI